MNSTYLDNYFNQNPKTFNAVRKSLSSAPSVDLLIAEPSKDYNSIDLVTVAEKNGSTFSEDKNFHIAKISWNGHVDIHTAKKLIRLAFEAIQFKKITKLILDHSDLVSFETEARVWVKELIKHKAESVTDKLQSLASISPRTAIGSVYSNFASEVLKNELPTLKARRFDVLDKAMVWIA